MILNSILCNSINYIFMTGEFVKRKHHFINKGKHKHKIQVNIILHVYHNYFDQA